MRRARRFNACVNKATLVWLGPTENQLQADFDAIFGSSLETDATCFLVASDVEVYREQCQMASKRGNHMPLPSQDDASAPLLRPEQVYTPGQLLRMREYRGTQQTSAFFADLEQTPVRGASTPGPLLPSLLTHGTVHSFNPDRLVTPRELYLAHGYNRCPSQTQCPVPCLLEDFLSSISSRESKELLGNGWHLPTMASFFCYILAHCVSLKSINEMMCRPEKNLLIRGGTTSSFEDNDVAEDESGRPLTESGSKRARLCK